MDKYYIVSLILIIISALVGLWLYPQMPNMMPSHWNTAGQIDAYSPKATTLFAMPIIAFLMLLLFIWLPKADPKQENVAFNKPYYQKVVLVLILFFVYLYALTIATSMGYSFNMTQFLIPGMGFLFFVLGKQMEKIKQNWFFGVRVPWTIQNEVVWDKTHKIASKLFKAFGILLIGVGLGLPQYVFVVMMALIIAIVVFCFIYPYLEWKKLQK